MPALVEVRDSSVRSSIEERRTLMRGIFPAFGEPTQPPRLDVAAEQLPEQPGEYECARQLGMLRSQLIVLSAPLPSAGGRAA